jgi:hypothetical protein
MRRQGEIKSAYFGLGGKDNSMLGIDLHFSGEGWHAFIFIGAESQKINVVFGKIALRIHGLLTAAEKKNVADLVGTPVEVEFDDGDGRMKAFSIFGREV